MLKRIYLSYILILIGLHVIGQISPGELSEAHAHLEGISNCTKCHELGEKVSDDKCLACHQELKARIDQKKGFHSSPQLWQRFIQTDKSLPKVKSCILCHSEHLTRKYDIVHLDKSKFDHQTTGFVLEGKHSQKQCQDCHKIENIKEESIKKKKMTFLGLSSACLSCHADYHQETLSQNCTECHTFEGFKTAPKFDHNKAKFTLIGRHKEVDCKKCHEISTVNGKAFQKFKGLQFNSCVNCHKDIHDNKFGQNCVQCHSEDSFKEVKSIGQFDHNKTNFRLEGKHITVSCKSCHKGSLISQIKYNCCNDCHADFHKGQFNKAGVGTDCRDCHSVEGFKESSFTIERHNQGDFKLEGAHVAAPCILCHQKGEEWQFSNLDKRCVKCHTNIHKGIIDEKYMPEEKCDKCHTTLSWNTINFDHQITKFELKGKHQEQSCGNCHLVKNSDHQIVQKFNGFTGKCVECHADIHQKQFDENGSTDCSSCHGFENWKAEKFNHNLTRFKLEGGHLNVGCRKCHFEDTLSYKTLGKIDATDKSFLKYKNTELKCISCHR